MAGIVQRSFVIDFPLGNPCGRPYDVAMQRVIVGFALDLLESARLPRTTVQTPLRWSDDESWKERYARVDPERAEALRLAGEKRRAEQRAAKAGEEPA